MAVIEADVATMQVAMAFDYGQIDEGIRDEVKDAARSIHQLSAGVVTGIIAIGKRLIEVKGMIPHGQFTAWVESEFAMNERAAQRMMNVAREYGDPQKRQTLSVFSPSVMYLLSAPSTPEAARVEVEQVALSGQKVTVDIAKKAAAKFSEPKPTKAKPEPIPYAKVHLLETCVRQWLSIAIGEGGSPDPDSVLDMLKLQSREPDKEGNWLSLVCESLIEAEIAWRKSDLTQAINNVRDQRRQAKLQASARVTYMEPRVVVEPDEAPAEPTPDELEAMAVVAAEQVEEDAERAARDVERVLFERAIIEVEATATEIVTVTMPREIAEHLKRAAAAFKVGDMRLVDQAWLEVALNEALARKEVSE